MFAIFKREFRSYFQTVVGWLFVSALLAVYGLYFYVYNLKNGYPYITYDLKGIGAYSGPDTYNEMSVG